MRTVCFATFAAMFLVLGHITISSAGSAKEEYELQERCGERCEEVFEKRCPSVLPEGYGRSYVDAHGDLWIFSYECHYNRKLNKCFSLITSTTTYYLNKNLVDVNSNKTVGACDFNIDSYAQHLSVKFCYVLSNRCQSESEWDALVKPYMEE